MNAGQIGGGPVLITGATGFLGMELLARYLERTDRTILVPVRARGADEARARLSGVLELLYGRAQKYAGRVITLQADVERAGLGLAPADRDLVTASASEIVHCAATVSFAAGITESRQINVGGTSNLLALAGHCARRGVLRHFVHVSTAYVAGRHRGEFSEEDLQLGQRFRNPYERSKFEAELLVRDQARELPAVTIVRPSIIVGESTTGWTPSFNVLYVPVRAFQQRKLRVLPADPTALVDVVPVDHVADAILHLTDHTAETLSTYHLVAGEQAMTVGQLVELSARHLHRPRPPIVPPAAYRAAHPLLLATARGRRRAALRRVAPFVPYYAMGVRYRRDRAARALDPAGLRPPRLESYYRRLLDYAISSNWSRHPLPRPHSTRQRERVQDHD
jgi:thioester reductase-like protein